MPSLETSQFDLEDIMNVLILSDTEDLESLINVALGLLGRLADA